MTFVSSASGKYNFKKMITQRLYVHRLLLDKMVIVYKELAVWVNERHCIITAPSPHALTLNGKYLIKRKLLLRNV